MASATDGMNMWIDIGGSLYVAYTGEFSGPTTTTGWVQKTLESFDTDTWTPTFVSGSDSAFTPERGMEYYMNAKGQNYIVKRINSTSSSASDYVAKLELQTAANPVNTNGSASILPTGTAYLATPWNNDIKYTLVSDPSDSNYLLMEVAYDASGTVTAGSVATDDQWGLVAYKDVNGDTDLAAGTGFTDDVPMSADGTALVVDEWGWIDPLLNSGKEPVQFNWEYAGTDGNDWGKQQFLVYADNPATGHSTGDYVILSDPITLTNVALYDNLGTATGENVSLQFDGWMHGLPDMYQELQKNGWSIEGLGDKVRRLMPGQLLTDGTTNYFVKPMETSLFLGIVNAFPAPAGKPDITQADSGVDLTSVPEFTAHNMDGTPTTDASGDPIQVKYSEGKAL